MPKTARLKPELQEHELVRGCCSPESLKKRQKRRFYLTSEHPGSPIKIIEGIVVDPDSVIVIADKEKREIPAFILDVRDARNIPPHPDGMGIPYKRAFAYENVAKVEHLPRDYKGDEFSAWQLRKRVNR